MEPDGGAPGMGQGQPGPLHLELAGHSHDLARRLDLADQARGPDRVVGEQEMLEQFKRFMKTVKAAA